MAESQNYGHLASRHVGHIKRAISRFPRTKSIAESSGRLTNAHHCSRRNHNPVIRRYCCCSLLRQVINVQ